MALGDNALTTLERLKIYLDVSESTWDTVIEMITDAVCELFNAYTNRTLAYTIYTDLYLDGNGMKDLQLPNYPVGTLTSVAEDDTTLTEGIDEDFLLYAATGVLKKYGTSAIWFDGPKAIKITYLAGYDPAGAGDAVPRDLELALFKQVAKEWQVQKHKTWGEDSRSVGESSVSLQPGNLLDEVEEALKRYVRFDA